MFKASVISFIIGIIISVVFGIKSSSDEENAMFYILHDYNYKPRNPNLQQELTEWTNETDINLKEEFKTLNENLELCTDLIKNNLLTEQDKFECKSAINIVSEYERFYKKSFNAVFEKQIKSCCKEEE
jgi:hypothetical protein